MSSSQKTNKASWGLAGCAVFALLLGAALSGVQPAWAQRNQGPAVVAAPATPVKAVAPAMPAHIQRPMQAGDPVTLRAEGVEIRQWGIDTAENGQTPLNLKALERLDQLIAGQMVSCRIEGGTIPVLLGRCATADGQDIALTLLGEGLVVRNRRQIYNTPFASAYGQAEELARLHRRGIWAQVSGGDGGASVMTPRLMMLLLIGVPAAGFAVMLLLMWAMLQRIATGQRMEFDRARRKENALAQRERSVLISMLEGELIENKNKIDAFLTIYTDMLSGLRDLDATPKYQQVGDIVQRHPSFSHIVFDANVNKLSLLGIQLSGKISKLYAALPRTQEYITLDPNVPLETAVKLVEKVVEEARGLDAPLSALLEEVQSLMQPQGKKPAPPIGAKSVAADDLVADAVPKDESAQGKNI